MTLKTILLQRWPGDSFPAEHWEKFRQTPAGDLQRKISLIAQLIENDYYLLTARDSRSLSECLHYFSSLHSSSEDLIKDCKKIDAVIARNIPNEPPERKASKLYCQEDPLSYRDISSDWLDWFQNIATAEEDRLSILRKDHWLTADAYKIYVSIGGIFKKTVFGLSLATPEDVSAVLLYQALSPHASLHNFAIHVHASAVTSKTEVLFQQAIFCNPADFFPLFALGEYFRIEHIYDYAKYYLERAAQANPQYFYTFVSLGLVCRQLSDKKCESKAWQQALLLSPKQHWILEILGKIDHTTHPWEILEFLQTLMARQPHPEILRKKVRMMIDDIIFKIQQNEDCFVGLEVVEESFLDNVVSASEGSSDFLTEAAESSSLL